MTAQALELFGFGILVGGYGAMVGAGGGFLMVPALILLFRFPHHLAVGTSLTAVWLNATAGALLYLRQGRVDVRSGVQFAAATIPGAIGGVYLSRALHPRAFEVLFGVLMAWLGIFMVLRPRGRPERMPLQDIMASGAAWRLVMRELVDRGGSRFTYRFPWWRGIAISSLVGLLSSLLGIGGGPLHVPGMVFLLGFPVHVAVATSLFVLAISALVGGTFYFILGHVAVGPALALGGGAIAGALLGTGLAGRLASEPILRLLALALIVIGIRLVVGS
jgi:hypothetical protein